MSATVGQTFRNVVAIEKDDGFEVWCDNELLCTNEPLESITSWAQVTPRVDVVVILKGMELGAIQTWLAGGPAPGSEMPWLEKEKACQRALLSR